MNKSRLLTSLVVLMALMSAEAQASDTPRLVVNILVDQLRTDYMEAFSSLYGEGGFRRLMNEARFYADAQHPFRGADRASAAATQATGTTPSDHGIVGLTWLSRATLQPLFCVDDARYKGLQTTERSSAAHLLTTTLSDELEQATGRRAVVYSICPERDMAVLLAGHAADGAFWIDDQTGSWCGTSYYGDYPGWAAVYERMEPLGTRLRRLEWTPRYEGAVSSFHQFHSASAEQKKGFSHKFAGDRRIRLFKQSALVNDEVCRFLQRCLDGSVVGRDYVPDLLNIGLYAANFDHRPVADSPAELQDTYVKLDSALSRIFTSVERVVGRGSALFVVSSTGYADADTDGRQLEALNIPTGQFDMDKASMLLNMYLGAIFGQAQYVEATRGGQFYLDRKLIEKQQLKLADVLARSEEFLAQMTGVREVYTSQRLILARQDTDAGCLRAGWNASASGDILVSLLPGWRLTGSNQTESQPAGQPYISYPLFFLGPTISPAHLTTPVSTTVVAPTLARCLHIRAPNGSREAPLEVKSEK